METVKEVTAEVKEATAKVTASLRPKAQLSTLREVVNSEGFDDKRGWRRILALWGANNIPFYR
jgi:SH3-like domain-containing protein